MMDFILHNLLSLSGSGPLDYLNYSSNASNLSIFSVTIEEPTYSIVYTLHILYMFVGMQ
jgi:hypothetical protein